ELRMEANESLKELLELPQGRAKNRMTISPAASTIEYSLPTIPLSGCTDNSWTPTSTVNAPAARKYHAAVWTGSEMIVWGGSDAGGNPLNSGGRYNPSTDSWTAMSTVNAPSRSNLAVWTGKEMLVSGGKYDPLTDHWT